MGRLSGAAARTGKVINKEERKYIKMEGIYMVEKQTI